jgi:4-hydroxy-3-polyprenylbenzoate decarboxylase
MKIIVGISGASGAIYGIRLLEELKKANVESHLVISKWAFCCFKLWRNSRRSH